MDLNLYGFYSGAIEGGKQINDHGGSEPYFQIFSFYALSHQFTPYSIAQVFLD